MKAFVPLLCCLVIGSSVSAEEAVLATAGNGEKIAKPGAVVEVKDGETTRKVPAGVVVVPAGKFTCGEGARAREVELGAFGIGKFEVTNAEYAAFLQATGRGSKPRYWQALEAKDDRKRNHPVLFVSLVDAEAYCTWVSKETGCQVMVPSADQWEKAARGPQGWRYPWGNEKGVSYIEGKLE